MKTFLKYSNESLKIFEKSSKKYKTGNEIKLTGYKTRYQR